jgi:2'-5' RNA ligase
VKKLRLFAAIHIPSEITDRIPLAIEKIRARIAFPIRLLSEKNLHLTLLYLGYQSPEDTEHITEAMRVTAQEEREMAVRFHSITFGPHRTRERSVQPRMIWLNTNEETSAALGRVRAALQNNFSRAGIRFKNEARRFHGHVTLARFDPQRKERIFDLQSEFRHAFTARGMSLMQSRLLREGAEYTELYQIDFQNNGA